MRGPHGSVTMMLAALSVLTVTALVAEAQGTLEKIKKTRTITIGHRDSSRPFSFVGDDGRPTGYSVDLCVRIAAAVRVLLIGLGRTLRDTSKINVSTEYFSYEPYALMVRRGDSSFRLAVNRTLSRLYRSDEIVRIYDKWFGDMRRPGSLLHAMYILQGLPE